MSSLRSLIVVALSLVSMACQVAEKKDDDAPGGAGGAGGATGGGAKGAATPSDFLGSYAGLVCDALAPCCQKAGRAPAGDKCRSGFVSFGAMGSAGKTYDAASGAACLAAVQKALAARDVCADPTLPVEPACDAAFSTPSGGTKKPGESCSSPGDCASVAGAEVDCSVSPSGAGACRATFVGKVGDGPCSGSRDADGTTFYLGTGVTPPGATTYVCDRAAGSTCDVQTEKCVAIGKVGQPCASDDACETSAFCSAGTCAPRVAVGGPCDPSEPRQCAPKTRCDAANKTCKALAPDGAACTSSTQCASDRCIDQVCTASAPPSTSLDAYCGG